MSHNSGFKLLSALDYKRIIWTSNEHFTNRASAWRQTGIHFQMQVEVQVLVTLLNKE
jgi:hypothetical protein